MCHVQLAGQTTDLTGHYKQSRRQHKSSEAIQEDVAACLPSRYTSPYPPPPRFFLIRGSDHGERLSSNQFVFSATNIFFQQCVASFSKISFIKLVPVEKKCEGFLSQWYSREGMAPFPRYYLLNQNRCEKCQSVVRRGLPNFEYKYVDYYSTRFEERRRSTYVAVKLEFPMEMIKRLQYSKLTIVTEILIRMKIKVNLLQIC